jgi:hypothetical protein
MAWARRAGIRVAIVLAHRSLGEPGMSPSAKPQQTPQVVPFPDADSRPTLKLMDRVRHVIRARHYSRRTEEAYVHWIRRYIVFHRTTHPSKMGAAEMSTFPAS